MPVFLIIQPCYSHSTIQVSLWDLYFRMRPRRWISLPCLEERRCRNFKITNRHWSVRIQDTSIPIDKTTSRFYSAIPRQNSNRKVWPAQPVWRSFWTRATTEERERERKRSKTGINNLGESTQSNLTCDSNESDSAAGFYSTSVNTTNKSSGYRLPTYEWALIRRSWRHRYGL